MIQLMDSYRDVASGSWSNAGHITTANQKLYAIFLIEDHLSPSVYIRGPRTGNMVFMYCNNRLGRREEQFVYRHLEKMATAISVRTGILYDYISYNHICLTLSYWEVGSGNNCSRFDKMKEYISLLSHDFSFP